MIGNNLQCFEKNKLREINNDEDAIVEFDNKDSREGTPTMVYL